MDLQAVQDMVHGRKLLGAIRTVAGDALVGRCAGKEKEERRCMDGDSGSLVKRDW